MMKISRRQDEFSSLAGQLLIAMPNMDDLRFERAVIYIYHHSPKHGAMGVVVNRPADTMSLGDIMEHLQVQSTLATQTPPLLLGGPEELTRGFILHTNDYRNEDTIIVTPEIGLSSNQQALIDLIENKGPADYLILLGHATWAPGQLEDELMANVWLTAPSDTRLLFKTPYAKRWDDALQSIGITPAFLSHESGNV